MTPSLRVNYAARARLLLLAAIVFHVLARSWASACALSRARPRRSRFAPTGLAHGVQRSKKNVNTPRALLDRCPMKEWNHPRAAPGLDRGGDVRRDGGAGARHRSRHCPQPACGLRQSDSERSLDLSLERTRLRRRRVPSPDQDSRKSFRSGPRDHSESEHLRASGSAGVSRGRIVAGLRSMDHEDDRSGPGPTIAAVPAPRRRRQKPALADTTPRQASVAFASLGLVVGAVPVRVVVGGPVASVELARRGGGPPGGPFWTGISRSDPSSRHELVARALGADGQARERAAVAQPAAAPAGWGPARTQRRRPGEARRSRGRA
jgi:hypothetical protein